MTMLKMGLILAGTALAVGACGQQKLRVTPQSLGIAPWDLLPMVKRGDERGLKALLDRGLDVDVSVTHGSTLLMLAAMYDQPKIATLVLSRKPNLEQVSWIGGTALGYAAMRPRGEILAMLLKAGADPNGGKRGTPPLVNAAGYGRTAHIERLLRAGAKVDAVDFRGISALIMAAHEGHRDALRTLLRARADRSLRNRWGETALDVARQKGHKEIEKLLLKISP